jgi:hypothetical protein
MVSRAVQLSWRDTRLVFVLLVWAAFAGALTAYLNNGIALGGGGTHMTPAAAPAVSDDERYAGSIVVVPFSGHDCWKMMLDNRTGRMWGVGYVDCDAAFGVLAAGRRAEASRADRLNAIGASFRDTR